jgi:exosome complex component RRP4
LLSVSGPGFGKIPQGEVVKIPPPKVPRLIGKKGSMIRMIESASGARLSVGQNGMVVITGNDDSISVATKAIRKVDDEAHTADLNQRVEELLGIKSSDA